MNMIGGFAQKLDRYESVQPDKSYSLLGMRSRIGGPFVRETKKGSEISAAKLNKVKRGDLIYSRLFAWQGSFGLIPPEMDGFYVSNEFPLYKLDLSVIHPEYLVYWFGLPHIQKRIEADCSGSTPGTRNRFKEIFFEKLEIDLPSLDEQHQIVSKVNQLADRKEEILKLRHGCILDANALLNSAYRDLMHNSKYAPMSEVAPLIRRPVVVELNAEYAELGVRSFGKGTFHKPSLNGMDVGTKKLFHIYPDDLVLSNVFAWEGAIAVAKASDKGRVGSHRFITCVPQRGVSTSEFLCFYFLTHEGLEKIREASPGGAGRNKTLGLKRLDKIGVPVPAIEKQIWFNNLQQKVAEIQEVQKSNEAQLQALLPSILDKAFKGKLV